MKLRVLSILFLIAILAACGGVGRVNTQLHFPELDTSQVGDSYYQEGWKTLREGDPKLAVKLFQQSTASDEILHVGYGYAFLAQNKFDLARRNFRMALDLNAENLEARLGMASLYEELDDTEKAFDLYSRLLAEHPEHAWIKLRFQYIKTTQTEIFLKQAEQYKSENKASRYIGALKSAARYSPEIIEIKEKIAEFHYQEGEYEEAMRYYSEVLEKLPNKEDVLYRLGELYEKTEKIDSAIMVYKSLLELKPGDLDLSNKVNELKIKFYESDLPTKFKNIFFKKAVTREDVAALLGHYFEKYLETRPPVIIRDIASSYAREYIIKICSLKIMSVRPDNSFDRYGEVNRAVFAVTLEALLNYLERNGYSINITPLEELVEPVDIIPLHKNYRIIKYLVNAGIMKLDAENRFNSTQSVSPNEALSAIRKILYSIK